MGGIAVSVALLLALGAPGPAILRSLLRARFDGLERTAFGLPLGVVLSSLLLLALAPAFGLTPMLVLWVANAGVVFFIAEKIVRRRADAGRKVAGKGRQAPPMPRWRGSNRVAVIVIGLFACRWVFLWAGSYREDSAGLWAGDLSLWADWALHMGDVASFAWADNFPPVDPHYAGAIYAYHYLTSVTAAAIVTLGVPITTAMSMQSLLFSILVALAVYCFARRLTRDRTVGAMALVLFLVGGGMGWILTMKGLDFSHSSWMTSLLTRPWDRQLQELHNFRWLNSYFFLIEPQRSFLYGVPLALLTIIILREALEGRERRLFLAAGAVAGLLPFSSLSAMLALALITPFLVLLFFSLEWFWFFAAWILLAVPQLWAQQGGSAGAASAIRLQIGWIAAPDPWVWFWLKNLGVFLVVLLPALVLPRLLPDRERKLLLAFMPLFVIANLVVFQPWDWDNTKVLLFWYLAASVFVGAALVHAWRRQGAFWWRTGVIAAFISMTLSGFLLNLDQALGNERALLLTSEELRLGRELRSIVPPHSVFAVGLQHNHPVSLLTGRAVVMSYPGWLWSHGYDYAIREQELRRLYAWGPDALEVIRRYGIDYIVVGPWERAEFHAREDAMGQQLPIILKTEHYTVFHTER